MGKTKTAFITQGEDVKSGEDKYKERQLKKAVKEEKAKKVHISGLKGGQKIVAIETENLPKEEATTEAVKQSKEKKEKKRSNNYIAAKNKIDKAKFYPLTDAVKLTKETSYSKFDGSVELHLVVKKKGLSANVSLPFMSAKAKKIEIADDETIKKLQKISQEKNGKIDIDVLLATPDMMPNLIPFAKILGPKGLMPNPKNGTIIKNKSDAKNFSVNTTSLKTEKEAPIIHTVIGKVSQKEDELIKNADEIFAGIGKNQIVKAYIKSTMGPSIKIAL
ncbi:hypothetical protein A2W13_03520 [Candidatus Woesebacteria bacterium RBG_16_36_11]|uniref:Large ribosomal subunit protein uL1 n=1 Tax=Candidatus Woesebacteria bacterium RBG_16_36_11 TaxID=1802481 RepID=A0A1F7X9Q5_9BACT|nr:MAG: hypothetical protein A2W13_03520 [Candidatus Woesebacteria bacterium RBG_16_36_11]